MDRIQGRHHKEPLDLEKDGYYIISFAYVTPGTERLGPRQINIAFSVSRVHLQLNRSIC